jgi:small subunit ribosomal protein S21
MAREFRESKLTGIRVDIKENEPFAKALSRFKRKVNDSGILKEVQDRRFYVSPSDERKVAKKAARRRWAKYVEKNKAK